MHVRLSFRNRSKGGEMVIFLNGDEERVRSKNNNTTISLKGAENI